MKNVVFWDVEPCRYFVSRRFGGTYRLHLSLQTPVHADSSLAHFLYPEDGGEAFLRTSDNKLSTRRHIPKDGILQIINTSKNRDSAVGIAIGYGLDDQGVGVPVPVEERIVTCSCRPYWLLGLPNLLSNGYRGLFSRG
jgi:hypothetical protein